MAAETTISLARPRRREPAPPVEYIRDLKQEAEIQSRPVRDRWELIRQVRTRRHDITIPDAYKKTAKAVRTHFVGDILRTVKSSLTVNFPTFSVPPSSPAPSKQENATLREKWSNAVLQQLDSERPPKRVWPRLMDHACAYGLAVNKLVYTPKAWHDYPTAKKLYGQREAALDDDQTRDLDRSREEYKKGKLPFAWQAVDPRTWWGFYGEGELRECVEVTQRTVNELASRYAVRWDERSGRIRPDTVSEPYVQGSEPASGFTVREFVEHWTPEWVTYTCDEVVLAQWRHGYGRVPYFPFYGLSNDTADPGQEMESVVEHILDIVILYDNLLTMWQNWAYWSAFPSGWVKGPEGSAALQLLTPEGIAQGQVGPAEMQLRPGSFQLLPPGWERGFDVPPPVGKDLMLVSDILRQFIERTIPDVMRGIGKADQAGYAINQLIVAARLVYDPITDNASLAIGKMMEFVWWLIEHRVKERVYVWGYDVA